MRSSGVLMHLSSLPSRTGIGGMGKSARDFVDFLEAAGQGYWQLLPICPTGYGDSPYQSFSTYAGNPYFIDLDLLMEEGLLERQEYEAVDWESTPDKVNYGALYQKRIPILRKAAARFREQMPPDYKEFCEKNEYWLGDYARFMAMKNAHGGSPWQEWELRSKAWMEETYAEEICFWRILQYLFFHQWEELRSYAEAHGVRLIGDLPIYVAMDSADVWAHPELFQLGEGKKPKEVAGCPPDSFSEDGQLWGNPLFDWEYMAKDGYAWWVKRIQYLCSVYDVLRIDHFRGFDSYYAIPYGNRTARGGRWRQGPGLSLFRAVEETIGKQHIIAEDLGYLTDSVRQLLKDSGFPGMKVLQFAFDSRDGGGEAYLPENYPENCVAYVGTHDNDTALGWMHTAPTGDVALAKAYLRETGDRAAVKAMMRAVWNSRAFLAVVQAQDILELGSESRMNTPATVGENWRWRATEGSFTATLAKELRNEMAACKRINGGA